MTPGRELAALISRTGMPTPSDRELPLSVGSLLSQWDTRYTNGSAAQSSNRVSDPLTARKRNVLAFISQGCSNTRRCPIGREGLLIREARDEHLHRRQSAVVGRLPSYPYVFWYPPSTHQAIPRLGDRGNRETVPSPLARRSHAPARRHPQRRQRHVQRNCRSSSERRTATYTRLRDCSGRRSLRASA
jgi:hypothetical protein